MNATIRDLIEPSDSPDILQTADALVPVLYDDLRRAARRQRRHMQDRDTMQTTDLIHEAYLRLRATPGFNDRTHFLRASALAMRHVLVNRARDRMAAKRGGGMQVLPLDSAEAALGELADERVLEVNAALELLASHNLRLARIVECRFFAGYTEEEAATALSITDRTVRRDWIKARAWLLEKLEGGGESRL